MSVSVLVFGWYGNGNLGDELFRDAFAELLPGVDLTFVDRLRERDLRGKDAVIFGGGSFLYKKPWAEESCLSKLRTLPIAYVGVGVETVVDPFHVETMKSASAVFVRSLEGLGVLTSLGIDATYSPDIVHIIGRTRNRAPDGKKIIIVPNIEVVPNWSAPTWSTLAWERFKNETSQFLDERVSDGWTVSFLSMCRNSRMTDEWAATEIIAKMTQRSTRIRIVDASSMTSAAVLEEISSAAVVISQRYHGVVLSELVNVPSVSVWHHDKLKTVDPFRGRLVPYYEMSKRSLHEAVDALVNADIGTLDLNFSGLRTRLRDFVEEAHDGQARRNSR